MDYSYEKGELAKALKLFQSEVGNVAKDSTNPFFKSKYASLENIISTAKPVLAKHGLSYMQFPDGDGLTTVLMHESGEWASATANLHLKDQTPQGQGSAITYMRRYALSSILGIATEDDDDGNEASKPTSATTVGIGARAPKPVEKTKDTVTISGSGGTIKVEPPKKVADSQRAEIKDLLIQIADRELKMIGEFQEVCLDATGLELKPENFTEIITRLKAQI